MHVNCISVDFSATSFGSIAETSCSHFWRGKNREMCSFAYLHAKTKWFRRFQLFFQSGYYDVSGKTRYVTRPVFSFLFFFVRGSLKLIVNDYFSRNVLATRRKRIYLNILRKLWYAKHVATIVCLLRLMWKFGLVSGNLASLNCKFTRPFRTIGGLTFESPRFRCCNFPFDYEVSNEGGLKSVFYIKLLFSFKSSSGLGFLDVKNKYFSSNKGIKILIWASKRQGSHPFYS